MARQKYKFAIFRLLPFSLEWHRPGGQKAIRRFCLITGARDCKENEIWEYISADHLDAADRWIGKLFDAFEALG